MAFHRGEVASLLMNTECAPRPFSARSQFSRRLPLDANKCVFLSFVMGEDTQRREEVSPASTLESMVRCPDAQAPICRALDTYTHSFCPMGSNTSEARCLGKSLIFFPNSFSLVLLAVTGKQMHLPASIFSSFALTRGQQTVSWGRADSCCL